jgi:hypothetical protein
LETIIDEGLDIFIEKLQEKADNLLILICFYVIVILEKVGLIRLYVAHTVMPI